MKNTHEVDLRGLKCPEPAIRTGKALKNRDKITVIVDDPSAIENITGAVKKRGYSVTADKREKDIYLYIEKHEDKKTGPKSHEISHSGQVGNTVVFFASDKIGGGDDDLGKILVNAIIYSMTEVEPKPDTMIFMNNGVKLTVNGSKALEDLIKLEKSGLNILVCGTCLEFFGLKGQVAVGKVSNAYTITETLLEAGKVVRL